MNHVTNPMRSGVLGALAILSACGGGGGSSGSATPTDSNDNIVASSSVTGPIQAIVGSAHNLGVTFTTNDGKTATNFQVSTGLSALPAGWSGPASFSCASVSSGSGCMVNLTYAPTAVSSGTVAINYSYTNNAGTGETGTVSVDYAATAANNVVAAVSPAGQVAVVVGGTQAVSVTFTSDNGQPATNLSASPSALPAGWTNATGNASCAQVTTGSGCMLGLSYAPTADASGIVVVNYSYTDDSGIARTGSVNVPYAATSHDNAVATATPAGEIDVVIGGHQSVAVDFTTDDGNPATGLTITSGLSTLPAGWTGPANFSCATFKSGNGCELGLQFMPTQAGTGTVSLGYSYTDNSGAAKTGTLTIASRATAENGLTAVTAPSGTVNAVVGQPARAVTVTFTSNDGNPISNLSVTNGLASLPSGWSGPSSFACPTANTGNGCQLSLSYAPTAAASGTLMLSVGYQANSGAAKTGSVSIAYAATTQNNVVATAAPSGPVSAVVNSGSQAVTLTFTTDDGNPATSFTVTGGLTTATGLPSGWNASASSLSCATVSTGASCQVTLTYAPTANGNGTVSVGYSFTDNSGTPGTGTASISYSSIPGFAYVANPTSGMSFCAISAMDGSLSACTATASGRTTPYDIAFSGNFAYITPGAVATDVDACAVAADGSLGSCSSAHTFTSPSALAVSGGSLYVADADGADLAYSCTIDPVTGALSACTSAPVQNNGTVSTMNGIAVTASNAYIVDYTGENLSTCAVSSTDGSMSGCTQASLVGSASGANTAGNTTPTGVAVHGGNVYIGTGNAILLCPISSVDGSVSIAGCAVTGITVTQSDSYGFAFNNGYGYVSGVGSSGGVFRCAVGTGGTLDSCVASTDPALQYTSLEGIAVH